MGSISTLAVFVGALCAAPVDVTVGVSAETRVGLRQEARTLPNNGDDTATSGPWSDYGTPDLMLTLSPQLQIGRDRGSTRFGLGYTLNARQLFSESRSASSRSLLLMHLLEAHAQHGRETTTLWTTQGRFAYGSVDRLTAMHELDADRGTLSTEPERDVLKYYQAAASAGVSTRASRFLRVALTLNALTTAPLEDRDDAGASEPTDDDTLLTVGIRQQQRLAADLTLDAVREHLVLTVTPSVDKYEDMLPFWSLAAVLSWEHGIGPQSTVLVRGGGASVWDKGRLAKGPRGRPRRFPIAEAVIRTVLWGRSRSHLDFDTTVGVSPYYDILNAAVMSRGRLVTGLDLHLRERIVMGLHLGFYTILSRGTQPTELAEVGALEDHLATGRLSGAYLIAQNVTVEAALEVMGRWSGNDVPRRWQDASPHIYGTLSLVATHDVL